MRRRCLEKSSTQGTFPLARYHEVGAEQEIGVHHPDFPRTHGKQLLSVCAVTVWRENCQEDRIGFEKFIVNRIIHGPQRLVARSMTACLSTGQLSACPGILPSINLPTCTQGLPMPLANPEKPPSTPSPDAAVKRPTPVVTFAAVAMGATGAGFMFFLATAIHWQVPMSAGLCPVSPLRNKLYHVCGTNSPLAISQKGGT
jgi:hypothetical protein